MHCFNPVKSIPFRNKFSGISVDQSLLPAFSKSVEAKPHTPVYTMHKYFARRPWNVFRELISHYTLPGMIVLDPFCGGGVTVVEALKLGRKAIGVDVNSLATYVTRMEAKSIDLDVFEHGVSQVRRQTKQLIMSMYRTICSECKTETYADWIEWDEVTKKILRLRYACSTCGYSGEKEPGKEDIELSNQIEQKFQTSVEEKQLSFPTSAVPPGDKTNSLLSKDIHYFHELFTRRNLLALAILKKQIDGMEANAKDFLQLAFSGSLKWASRQSHLRGEIVEGWALHAYWIYSKSLEINVWNTFERRCQAIARGKRYSNQNIESCKFTERFAELDSGQANCMIMTRSSANLPLPDASVDAIITDPPYGGNVNYGELADYWLVWHENCQLANKKDEVIINSAQAKDLEDYENLLSSVFRECYRVLKTDRCLVSTFNSRDLRIVASFVLAASRAGFVFHPNGLHYQSPIRAYNTTFHAMQIGAFVGDFIFTFIKPTNASVGLLRSQEDLENLKQYVKNLVNQQVIGEITEPQVREKAYSALIPFLARYSISDIDTCRVAVDVFESEMRRYNDHFKSLRKKMTDQRRQSYLSKKRKP